MRTETFKDPAYTRTVSPSVHPRLASGDATNFFLASALLLPTGLATSRERRRAMRPTDVCHPNELRAPAPRAFPAALATFAAGTPHGVLGSVRLTGGPDVSRRPKDRFGGSSINTLVDSSSRSHDRFVESRAWAFSSHGADAIEPLTPLSRPPLHPRASLAFASAAI